MDPALEEILYTEESQFLDYKESDSLKDSNSIAKQLVGFSNRNGGLLVYGITDDGFIEGAEIAREESINRVSRVARAMCDPPVNFSSSFFKDQRGVRDKGDILIINIDRNDGAPSAVIRGKDGSKRRYYLRTGTETRPISNSQEVQQLHQNNVDPSIRKNIWATVMFDPETFELVDLVPDITVNNEFKNMFNYFIQYIDIPTDDYTIYERYPTDNSLIVDDYTTKKTSYPRPFGVDYETEVLQDYETVELTKILSKLTPFVILNSLSTTNPDYSGPAFENRKDIEYIHLIDFKLETESKILEKYGISLEDIRRAMNERSRMQVPKGTNIEIIIDTDSKHYDSVHVLKIEKEAAFEIIVSVSPGSSGLKTGTPYEFPGYIYNEDQVDTWNFSTRIHLNSKFEFPDSNDPKIQLHREFHDAIIQDLTEIWSYKDKLEQSESEEIYEMIKLLRKIEEKVDIISKHYY